MKSKCMMWGALAAIVVGCLYWGFRAMGPNSPSPSAATSNAAYADQLVRPYSATLGPEQAPVTLVEFFDPACEACRAFYPVVKDLMKQYPQDLRLVLRYAAFHPGSDKVVRLLQAAKEQDKFWPVLEALLTTQPMWANHSRPNLEAAYQSAEQAGLDLQRAMAVAHSPEMDAVLQQERRDLMDLKIEKTPTFFVNGEGLSTFGAEPLAALVASKVAAAKK